MKPIKNDSDSPFRAAETCWTPQIEIAWRYGGGAISNQPHLTLIVSRLSFNPLEKSLLPIASNNTIGGNLMINQECRNGKLRLTQNEYS
jgi:hypothetical protein